MFAQLVVGDVEESELAEEFLNPAVEETLVAHRADAGLGILGYEESYAALVEEHPFLRQVVIAAHHGVGVDLERRRIFAHRGDAVALGKGAGNHRVAYAVGNLQIYGLVVFLEYHNYYQRCMTSDSLKRKYVSA